MPLVSRVGRKSPKAKLAFGVLYLLLSLGAFTTLYPFLMMAGLGLKGASDQNLAGLVAPYLVDDEALYQKGLLDKHSGNAERVKIYTSREGRPPDVGRYRQWLETLPVDRWLAGHRNAPGQVTGKLSELWQTWLRARYGSVDKVNRAYNELNQALPQVAPPAELLERPGWASRAGQKWKDWQEFKTTLPITIRIPITGRLLWQGYLRREYKGVLAEAPVAFVQGAKTFEEVNYPQGSLKESPFFLDFLKDGVPTALKGNLPEEVFGPLPLESFERQIFQEEKGAMRWEFATRNFRYVAGFLAGSGRVLWNTVLFCFLAVLAQLIVNPLAAYALSRFPLKASNAILLFLLATMAFPAEVAMIPSFLLLKDLGLLNTYAALVLPAAASGFMIFLLKGFFDSLPKEIFESGQIDGAPEWVMMLKLALPLSRPVLGYLALLAFMGAYGSFMFAFLVVQKREMWTLMVLIFQMQGYAPKAVMMAALTLAALPTLVVFMAAQKVIMRGIVLPSER